MEGLKKRERALMMFAGAIRHRLDAQTYQQLARTGEWIKNKKRRNEITVVDAHVVVSGSNRCILLSGSRWALGNTRYTQK